jgi:hypothetical protein
MTQEWKRQRDELAKASSRGLPISKENLKRLVVRAIELGNVDITDHLRKRCAERQFTTVDAENILRNGTIVGPSWFDIEFETYRLTMRGKVEGKILDIGVAIDPSVDYEYPLVSLTTGIRNGEADDHGKNRKNEKKE